MVGNETKFATIDPLRRDLLLGAAFGFLLLLATMAICWYGVRQISLANDAQSELDRTSRYLQATMRGVGEVILAEGASDQVKALQANLGRADAAVAALAGRMPDDQARSHFKDKVQPGWKAIGALIGPFATRSGVNAASDTAMAEYGKLLSTMESFEADFAVIDKVLAESVAASTNRAYLMAGGMLAVVLALFVLLNAATLRHLRRSLGGDLSYAVDSVRQIAAGNLTLQLQLRQGDTSSLLHALGVMSGNLLRTVREIRVGADAVGTAAQEIAQGQHDMSSRTEQQASSLEEMAASMEQMTATVGQNAENAHKANQLAAGASDVALRGGQAVRDVVGTMAGITQSSKKIADIIGVIDGIAFQTNILALNAAVEAARAGEQGRGFAVVASEVRSLAQRSAAAAKEIKDLIGDSVAKVDIGSKQVEAAGKTVDEIVASVKSVTTLIAEIATASQEQSQGIAQVSETVAQMEQVTLQNAAMVEEMTAASGSLEEQAQALVQAVGSFKLSEGEQAQAAAVRSAAAPAPRPATAKQRHADHTLASSKLTRLPGRAKAKAAASSSAGDDGDEKDWKEF